MTTSILAAGFILLVLVAAGFVVLWIIDARRADHIAADPERVEGQIRPSQSRRWWPRTLGHR